jgi:flagellar hook protein FlgE
MSISATAMTTMALASQRLEASAARVARSGEAGSHVDIGAELAEQTKAKAAFNTGAAVLRAGDEMLGELLDVKA